MDYSVFVVHPLEFVVVSFSYPVRGGEEEEVDK
jgi:hypothetical protein